MDNDPSQRSRAATTALEEIEAELHEIPPRSPDLNINRKHFPSAEALLRGGSYFSEHNL